MKMNGGGLVVRTLETLGVRTIFGVPGGQTLTITDATLDSPSVSFVATRHENAAAVMADATGRLTGVPGVCLATTGPGATNLLTGVGGAMRDSSPVIVLTCNNRLPDVERDDAQNADHVAIFRPLVKHTFFVADPLTIPRVLADAARRATSGNPGPVLIDLARSALEAEVDVDAAAEGPRGVVRVGDHRPVPAGGELAAAVDALRSSERPVIWVGNGVQLSAAEEDVLALAERIDAPIITTFNSIGAVPSSHPNAFGPLTRMGTRLAAEVLRGADLVVALGNSMNAISTARWSMPMPGTIVQVDVDPGTVGRNYPGRTLPVVGDVRETLRAVLPMLADPSEDVRASRRDRLKELSTLRAEWWAEVRASIDPVRTPASPVDIVLETRRGVPDDTIAFVDAGNPGVWAYLWEIRTVRSFYKPVGFGNMGFALPAAVASVVDDPDRPVVVLVGDGSLGMSLGELETLARVGGRVCVVVMNDSGYGNIRQEQTVFHGADRHVGVDFLDVDFAQVARGLGVRSHRVDCVEGLVDLVAGTLGDGGGPALIDVVMDPVESAWTYGPFRIKP